MPAAGCRLRAADLSGLRRGGPNRWTAAAGATRRVMPTRSIAAGISAFRMNSSQTRPERKFSALSSVIPRSIPITPERLLYWVVIERNRRSSDLCTREMFSSS
jgi:hypothetical protein